MNDPFAPTPRDLEPVASVLDAVLARVGGGRAPGMIRLVAEWPTLAPPPWNAKSRPVALRGGTLVVEVVDGATASLLRYQVTELLTRLREGLGAGIVEHITLRVGRSRGRRA